MPSAAPKLPRKLGLGSRGRDVRALQRGLWRAGYRKVGKLRPVEAPEYGKLTKEQVQAFQVAHNIPATGKFGEKTFEALWPHYDRRAKNLVNALVEDLKKPPPETERMKVMHAMWVAQQHAWDVHYTQGGSRWQGISDTRYPPQYPNWADCSSITTWAYWTRYGHGPDFINGAWWRAGFTGTQINHGRIVSYGNAKPGDLVFYGSSFWHITHVAMYVGNGMVLSHGSESGPSHRYIDYRSDRQMIRAYIP